MPNHTWTDSDGVEWIRVDIPRGAHGNWLAGIRENPECMDYEGEDYDHQYCSSSDQDECLASEFTYDARGLISTFRKELMTKASHGYRIVQYPEYFTAEEVEAARLATSTSELAQEGARYVTFPIHTSRRSYADQYGAGAPEPTPLQTANERNRQYRQYMRANQARFDQMIDRYVSRQPAEAPTLFDFINQPTDEPNIETDFTEGINND